MLEESEADLYSRRRSVKASLNACNSLRGDDDDAGSDADDDVDGTEEWL